MADKLTRISNRTRVKSGSINSLKTLSWDDFGETDSEEDLHSAICTKLKGKKSKEDKAFKKPSQKVNKSKQGKVTTPKVLERSIISGSQSRIDELLTRSRKKLDTGIVRHGKTLYRSATFTNLCELNNESSPRFIPIKSKVSREDRLKNDSCESFTSALSTQDMLESESDCIQLALMDNKGHTASVAKFNPESDTAVQTSDLSNNKVLEGSVIAIATTPVVFKASDAVTDDIELQLPAGDAQIVSDAESEVFLNLNVGVGNAQKSINTSAMSDPATVAPKGDKNMDYLDQRFNLFEAKIAATITATITQSMQQFKNDIRSDIAEMKTELATSKTTINADVDRKIKEVSTSVKSQINGCVVQVQELQNVMIRQGAELAECKEEIIKLQQRSMNLNLIIRGLTKSKNQKWSEAASNLFKTEMGLNNMELVDAFKTWEITIQSNPCHSEGF